MVSSKDGDTVLQVDGNTKNNTNKKNPMPKHPVEIEYWYILPSIRREISTYLKNEKNLKQKMIAKILGITEAGVSQYLKGTRGVLKGSDDQIIEIPKWIKEEVAFSCDLILKDIDDQNIFLREVNRILLVIRERSKEFLCKIHFDLGYAEEDCNICLES